MAVACATLVSEGSHAAWSAQAATIIPAMGLASAMQKERVNVSMGTERPIAARSVPGAWRDIWTGSLWWFESAQVSVVHGLIIL